MLVRSEEHTSELQSHSEISYAVFCLKKKKTKKKIQILTFYVFSWFGGSRDRRANRFPRLSEPSSVNDAVTTYIPTNLHTRNLRNVLPISPVTFTNFVCRLMLVTR